jgi:hypothetical protein
MSDDRDVQLGDAINALPVPARDDGFMADLGSRLVVVDADRASAGVGVTVHPFSRWLGQGRRPWLLVAAAAAAIVLALTLFGPGRGAEKNGGGTNPMAPIVGPEPAAAAQIIRSSLAGTGDGHSMRGVVLAGVVRDGRLKVNVRERYVVSVDGSVAVGGTVKRNGSSAPLGDYVPGATCRATYDASARTTTFFWHFSRPMRAQIENNGKVMYFTFTDQAFISRGLAAGPPENGALDGDLPLARLRANMLQLVADGSASSASVRDVVAGGRPAWLISTTQLAPGNAPVPPSAPVTLVVDKATRLPVVYTWVESSPRQEYELRFEDFVVGREAVPGAFIPRFPVHTWIIHSSNGYRVIDFSDAKLLGTTIGYAPAFPSWMPPGFRLASPTYSAAPSWKPAGGQWQPEPDAASVSLAYRRGFDAVCVSCSLADTGSGSYSAGGKRTYQGHFDDPFVQLYGPAWRYLESRTHDVRLSSGPFAGSTAHIVVDPSVPPHLWVTNGGYTATVSGDLSARDMVRVAESLRRGVELASARPSPSG